MIKAKIDEKEIPIEKGCTIQNLLKINKEASYHDNPIVAATVNGELKSLSYSLIYDTEIKPVYLFSPLGKRVYRHSLCFLLSYAFSTLFPNQHLLIGHSLGDGYFFSIEDGEVSDDMVTQLTEKMLETVKENASISKKKLPLGKAKEKLGPFCRKLLQTNNPDSITAFELNGFVDTSYEPIVAYTKLLSLWDLRKYENGMLLRYPQSRDFTKMQDFKDNPKLFQTLKRNMLCCERLKVESIGDLNELIKKGERRKLIELSEAILNRSIGVVASHIGERETVKLVLIAGPSSSGKTTSSLKLSSQMEILGYAPIKISLDDYYKPTDEIPKDEDGKTDFEALEALNLPLFREQMADLINGAEVHLMKYDFKTRTRAKEAKTTIMKENSILIVEGIHGLNPALLPDISDNLIFRIYISALTTVNIDDHNRISTTDNRIIRRMVRDERTRGVSATETLSMWPQVERGEKFHIFPYQNNADAMINSALPYELSALAPAASNLLKSVEMEAGDAYTLARRLLKFLEFFYTIPDDDIPKESVLREFLGGSYYGAI